ncbi:MAG: ribosomal protein S18-alanine N-acetyltransferase [Oscillospiraceae bacterium]|jgi:ribosomal-protein-alanine N-acetyltransferase|nr:ribosomal protein S18-alanine N-acetyltransferase [Oscillospiraceae bacterium]
MINEINIKPATIDDLMPIARIETACFTNPWWTVNFQIEFNNPDTEIFIAVDTHGEIAGFICITAVLDEFTIADLAVLPQMRRCGIARKLMQTAFDFAKSKNAASVTLEVRVSNSAAIGLYEGFGFKKVGLRQNYYRNPQEDAVLMTVFL